MNNTTEMDDEEKMEQLMNEYQVSVMGCRKKWSRLKLKESNRKKVEKKWPKKSLSNKSNRWSPKFGR